MDMRKGSGFECIWLAVNGTSGTAGQISQRFRSLCSEVVIRSLSQEKPACVLARSAGTIEGGLYGPLLGQVR